MGAAQSTRKITLVDDEKAGVIKLSESLAQRLRGQIEGQHAALSERVTPAAAPEPVSPSPPPAVASLSPSQIPEPYSLEPPKVPDVLPFVPEPLAPKPVPRGVSPEPEPQAPGESHPPDAISVDDDLPSVPAEASAEGTSLSFLSPSAKITDSETHISHTEQSKPEGICETEVSGSENVAIADSDAEVHAVAASDTVPFPDVSNSLTAEASVEADAADSTTAVSSVVEVQLPSAETLLAAAFGSDPVESTPPSSVVEVPMPKPPELKLPIPQQVEVTAPDVDVAIRAGPGPTLVQPGGSIPPWSIYAEEAHLMVMRLREEKEQEIKKLNQAWREKMDSREQEFAKISGLSEEQVSSALKEVESLFMKASCTPVCQNQQEAVMNCYQDHPRQSLRCAREVEHFTQCVDLSRLQSIMKQEAH